MGVSGLKELGRPLAAPGMVDHFDLSAGRQMNEIAIRDRLVEKAQTLYYSPRQPIPFIGDQWADSLWANGLLNDLATYPHAFVLACIMDRQVRAEIAWFVPFRIAEKIGGFSMQELRSLSRAEVKQLMTEPEPLHRFVDKMTDHFWSAVQRIDHRYGGDATRIWAGKPPSAEVVYRFLEFDGVGPKIASMAANILAREFKVPFADYYSIDISADVHVRRVFGRLSLCAPEATVEQVIYKARALYPVFPGIIDLPVWEIGRQWCKPSEPVCAGCYMRDICPTANGRR